MITGAVFFLFATAFITRDLGPLRLFALAATCTTLTGWVVSQGDLWALGFTVALGMLWVVRDDRLVARR